MSNLYIYFSGTGNTRYVVKKFSELLETSNDYTMKSIEHKDFDYAKAIENSDTIVIGYPIYGSDLPYIVRDFLKKYKASFHCKKIITIATQYKFSGDGAALAYYMLKKEKVKILHSIHIIMPSNISDVAFFKTKPINETINIIAKADKKITKIVQKIKAGKTIKMGRRFYSRPLGYFCQRMLGKPLMKVYPNKLKIDEDKCILCKKCIDVCPVENLSIVDHKIVNKNLCTLCYRCVNACPEKAISLMSKQKPKKQYIRERYN